MQRPICQVMLLAWFVSVGHLAIAQEPVDQTDNEIADIKLAIQSYVTAFNSRDADKLISHWHPDPQQKQVRSWLFDSNGVRVEGTWVPRDDRWIVRSVATLADGTSGSFTSVFRPLEDGSYAWKKINRVLDGKILPNIDEVVVRRKLL